MDGQLRPEDEAIFSRHMATCASCTEMFEQVRRGREWLEFLTPGPDVPGDLLDRILLETGPGKLDAGRLAVAGGPAVGAALGGSVLAMPPVWQRPGFTGHMRRFAEPRLLMTAAMAFFSIALTLSITGVRISTVHMADLRPAALRSVVERRIMTASTPIIRYYDHLRFVYEVESRMRELRRSTETERQAQPSTSTPNRSQPSSGDGETHRKDGGSKLNPNEAPQQTVNPPISLWGGDTLEAELRLQPKQQNTTVSPPTLTEASGLDQTGLIKKSVLATPERSTSCLA
jgi:hypothetical protein